MKDKKYKIFILLMVLFQLSFIHAQKAIATEEDDVSNVVVQFLQHLKSGNTDGVLELITDPMLTERGALLQNNPNYSNILMDVYKDTDFQVTSVTKADDLNFSVSIDYLENNEVIKRTVFLCQKENNMWKISEEIRDGE